MKRISITNIEKLQAALDEVQKRCSARTIKAQDIVDVLNEIKVPKKHLDGTKVYWDGAEKFPNAYKYRPESTHWWAENVKGRWYVLGIDRGTCPNRSSRRGEITFSEAAKAWILEQASAII